MTNTDRSEGLVEMLAAMTKIVWILLVLVWTPLKWVLSLEVLYRFLVACYHWDTPGSTAGWTFLLHFSVLVAVTYFVSIYKPKGI